jgi:hypothetical protein
MNAKEIQQCTEAIEILLDKKHAANNQFFLGPVKPLLTDFTTYLKTIAPSTPIDLGTVKDKLLKSSGSKGGYSTPTEFASDVRMTFTNAITFNKDDKVIFVLRFERHLGQHA